MRIVQTFWTAGRNPLEYSFGWLHPEYNLMSWSLSCLSLREHYDEVALYTDTRGKEVLIDLLHLPYTEVHVVFDDFPCLPQHWALSKIKTYSLQDKPFLHIDGDVYLPKPIDPAILDAPLIAQNREIGTGYYRRMMNRILSFTEITMPPYIEKGLEEKSIASYNMGIFGGTDIEFIQRYCHEVFSFMDGNEMNNPRCRQSAVDCNVFFEQVIFAVLADREEREVASVLGRPMRDEGYTGREFCDLLHFRNHPFFHVLGGHKRNQGICNSLERAMQKMHDEIFWPLANMFPGKNWRLAGDKQPTSSIISAERCIAQYEDFLEETRQGWKDIPADELHEFEKKMVRQEPLSGMAEKTTSSCILKRNQHLNLFTFPRQWNPKATELLHKRLKARQKWWAFDIAMVPSLMGYGIREVPVANLGHNILAVLHSGSKSLGEIEEKLSACFSESLNMDREAKRKQILSELDYLAFHGVIEINK